MPNDAKLGLLVGVAVVLAVAVVFFRKESIAAGPEAAAASVAAPAPAATSRTVNGRATSTVADAATSAPRRHIVLEGETLFSLAQHYYGDQAKSLVIYQANLDVVKSPEQLTPGMLLVIPTATPPQRLAVETPEKP
jgi:nucleoid-associated protein YgaU